MIIQYYREGQRFSLGFQFPPTDSLDASDRILTWA